MLSYDWLKEFIEKNPKAIRYMKAGDHDSDYILTADTAELQKFVLRHLKTPEAWSKDTVELKRQ